jgi:hypothetical protein
LARAPGTILGQGAFGQLDQILIAERLAEKVDCAILHCSNGRADVVAAVYENDRNADTRGGEFLLKIRGVSPG